MGACVPRPTVPDHMKEDFNLNPYHLTFTNELSHVDMCTAGHVPQIPYPS